MKAQVMYLATGKTEIKENVTGVLYMPDGVITLIHENGGFSKYYPKTLTFAPMVTINIVEDSVDLVDLSKKDLTMEPAPATVSA